MSDSRVERMLRQLGREESLPPLLDEGGKRELRRWMLEEGSGGSRRSVRSRLWTVVVAVAAGVSLFLVVARSISRTDGTGRFDRGSVSVTARLVDRDTAPLFELQRGAQPGADLPRVFEGSFLEVVLDSRGQAYVHLLVYDASGRLHRSEAREVDAGGAPLPVRVDYEEPIYFDPLRRFDPPLLLENGDPLGLLLLASMQPVAAGELGALLPERLALGSGQSFSNAMEELAATIEQRLGCSVHTLVMEYRAQ